MPMISDRQRRAIAINGDSIACRLTDNRAPSFGAQQMVSEQPDAMTEQHRLVGPASGEPLPDGRVGVRVRIPLSGCPSRRWIIRRYGSSRAALTAGLGPDASYAIAASRACTRATTGRTCRLDHDRVD